MFSVSVPISVSELVIVPVSDLLSELYPYSANKIANSFSSKVDLMAHVVFWSVLQTLVLSSGSTSKVDSPGALLGLALPPQSRLPVPRGDKGAHKYTKSASNAPK